MSQLSAKARDLGLKPEHYARQLVEEGLALQRQAESMSLAEIMEPVRRAAGNVTEAEIVKLVEAARTNVYPRRARRWRRAATRAARW